MKKELIIQLHRQFDSIANVWPEAGVEFWYARDLQEVLGYDRWENFKKVIDKALTSCETTGVNVSDHFREKRQKSLAPMSAPIPITILLTSTKWFRLVPVRSAR